MVPTYVRLTISGIEDEFSMSIKIHPQHWQNETKTVSDDCPSHTAELCYYHPFAPMMVGAGVKKASFFSGERSLKCLAQPVQ